MTTASASRLRSRWPKPAPPCAQQPGPRPQHFPDPSRARQARRLAKTSREVIRSSSSDLPLDAPSTPWPKRRGRIVRTSVKGHRGFLHRWSRKRIADDFGDQGLDIFVHRWPTDRKSRKPSDRTTRAGYIAAVAVSAYSMVSMMRSPGPLMRRVRQRDVAHVPRQRTRGAVLRRRHVVERKRRSKATRACSRPWRARVGRQVNTISAGPSRRARRRPSRRRPAGDVLRREFSAAGRSYRRRSGSPAAFFPRERLSSGHYTGSTLYVDKGYHGDGHPLVAGTCEPAHRATTELRARAREFKCSELTSEDVSPEL
jgi:hypothetical protein